MTEAEKQLLDNPPICPNCGTKTWWNFDMMGPGVWHLHCSNCHIGIHGYYINEIVKQFNLHHKPDTYIFIRNGKINTMIENGNFIIENGEER